MGPSPSATCAYDRWRSADGGERRCETPARGGSFAPTGQTVPVMPRWFRGDLLDTLDKVWLPASESILSAPREQGTANVESPPLAPPHPGRAAAGPGRRACLCGLHPAATVGERGPDGAGGTSRAGEGQTASSPNHRRAVDRLRKGRLLWRVHLGRVHPDRPLSRGAAPAP